MTKLKYMKTPMLKLKYRRCKMHKKERKIKFRNIHQLHLKIHALLKIYPITKDQDMDNPNQGHYPDKKDQIYSEIIQCQS